MVKVFLSIVQGSMQKKNIYASIICLCNHDMCEKIKVVGDLLALVFISAESCNE